MEQNNGSIPDAEVSIEKKQALNEVLRLTIDEYISTSKVTQAEIARKIGYSASAISAYRKGIYTGDIFTIERKIQDFLAREKERVKKISIPIVDLDINSKISLALKIVHEETDIGVIVGPAGIGKTTALREHTHRSPQTVLVEVDPTFTPYILTMETAKKLGIPGKGNQSTVTQAIIDLLRGSDRLVIYDEADYLTDGGLEWLRRIIHDKAGCALVLVGLPRLEHILRTVKGDHDQLRSRTGIFLSLQYTNKKDIRKLITHTWSNIDHDVLEYCQRIVGGSVRRTVKLMERAHRIMAIQDVPEAMPSLETIEEAAELILR